MPLYYGYGYGYGAMFDPLYLVVVIVSLVLGLAAQAYICLLYTSPSPRDCS